MRRAELVLAADKIVEAFQESEILRVAENFIQNSHRERQSSKENIDISTETLEAFQKYSLLYSHFGQAEKEILKIFKLESLHFPTVWKSFLGGRSSKAFRIYSEMKALDKYIPKFKDLLKQEYTEQIRSASGEIPEELAGKKLLTVVLPEEHGQLSTASRVSEIIAAISLLYESFLEAYQETQEPLIIAACDSGSDKSFDFLGVAKAIECIKDIILDVWDRVVLHREHRYSERLKLIANGMLPAVEKISEMEANGILGPEQAGKIKKQISDAIYQFLETGATIPEMYAETKFEPRLLMGVEPRLLTGTPEIEAEEEADSSESDKLSEAEAKELERLLEKAGKTKNTESEDQEEDTTKFEDFDEPEDFTML